MCVSLGHPHFPFLAGTTFYFVLVFYLIDLNKKEPEEMQLLVAN